VKRILGLIALAVLGWVLARKLLEREADGVLPAGGAAPGPAAEGGGTREPAAEGPALREPAAEGGAASGGVADLSAMSKAELYEQAKQLQIEGRSKMSKDELARAVSRARDG